MDILEDVDSAPNEEIYIEEMIEHQFDEFGVTTDAALFLSKMKASSSMILHNLSFVVDDVSSIMNGK